MKKILEFSFDISLFERNRSAIIKLHKEFIQKEDITLYELLEKTGDDSIYTDPNLFFYTTPEKKSTSVLSLRQVAWGYLKAEDRMPIRLIADRNGCVYLPQLGYLWTKAHQVLDVSWNSLEGVVATDDIEFDFQKLEKIHDNFVITKHYPEVMLHFRDVAFDRPIEETIYENKAKLIKALDVLKESSPFLYELIASVTKEICLFDSSNQNSFGTFNQLGTSFINTNLKDQSIAFFVEDLAHQCGHIIYYYLTNRVGDFLKVPAGAMLRDYTGLTYDNRIVYGAFHGLFTYTCILSAFYQLIRKEYYDKETEREVYKEIFARTGFYLRKFRMDLKNFNNERILTEKGFDYYHQYVASDALIRSSYPFLETLYYNKQPYVFSMRVFKELNANF